MSGVGGVNGLGSGARARRLAPLLVAAAVAFIINLAFAWPGIMTWDSNDQYSQAVAGRYNDWFPPIMAVLWHVLLKAAPWGTGLLTLHLALWWSAIALLSHTLARQDHWRAAWLLLLLGAAPLFVLLNSFILKDVGLTACIALAFAITYRRRTLFKHMAAVPAVLVILLLGYAALVRQNGVFAAAPIACYAFAPSLVARPLRLVAACLVICIVAIGLAGPINHRLIGAEDRMAKRSLILFDMTGIAFWSRDTEIFQKQPNPSIEAISSCYNAALWDALGIPPCNGVVERGYVGGKTLVRAILKHPVAYLRHRLAHYNQELFLWAPRDKWKFSDTNRPAAQPVGRFDAFQRDTLPVLQSLPFLSPALALALLTVLLATMLRRRHWAINETHRAAFYVALSGEAYALGYLLIGVANMYRYYEYTVLACAIALILMATTKADRSKERNRELVLGLSATAVCVLIVTSVARIVMP